MNLSLTTISEGDCQPCGSQVNRSFALVKTGTMHFDIGSFPLNSIQLPDESRVLAMQQLQTLAGVAKGLTRSTDMLSAEDTTSAAEAEHMQRARRDPRIVRLRETMLAAIRATVELWSTDAGISDVGPF